MSVMDKAKQYELFGSDSEDDDDDDAAAAAPPTELAPRGEEAGEEDEDDANAADDLFGGSDDEEEEAASAPAANSAAPVEFALPAMPRPPSDSKLFLVRCPNILAFQPRPFDPDTFEEEEAADEEDGGKSRAENIIRWRESRETGERQSNARIVTWSDGSMTMHVGNEVLVAQTVSIPEGSTHLYTRHKGSHLECHGVLKQKMNIAPASRHSKTHQALTHKIARVHTKGKKMQVITTMEDPEAKQVSRERDYQDKQRLMARQASHRARADEYADSGGLTADFLDAADEDDLDGNLGAIRAQFKNRKRGGAGASRGTAGRKVRKTSFGGGRRRKNSDDEEDEEDDDDDDEDEEEEDGDPAEMDGFIVGDSGDEDEAVESEEAEDSEEEKKRKKPKKGKKGKLVDSDSD